MAWALVQQKGASSSGSATTLSATFTGAVVVGNLIVVQATGFISATAPTITVSDGVNTYTAAAQLSLTEGTGQVAHSYYFAPATTAAALTVTITPSVTCYLNLIISEWSHSPGVVSYDNSAGGGTVGSATSWSQSCTFAGASDLALAMFTQHSTPSAPMTVGAGFTSLYSQNYVAGSAIGILAEAEGNVTSSPVAATATSGTAIIQLAQSACTLRFASYTLTGPTSGAVGAASTNFTLTPSSTIPSDTITLSDGAAGGTFSPTSLTFTASGAAQTFTYTPASTGAKTLTLTSGAGATVTGSPATYTASATYTLTGPTGGLSGSPSSNFTLAPSGTITSDAITLSDGGAGGTFTPTSLTFTASGAAQHFTYTPASTGVKTLTLASGDSYAITGSPWSYTSSNTVGYTLTGPSSGAVGSPSANFTLTPGSTVTSDAITLSDGGAGGTFAPTSLAFTNSSAAQAFTYTPGSAGAKTLTLTSGDGGAITGSPATYTALAPATGYTFSGASSAIVGVTSGLIYLTPNGLVSGSDTATLSDGGAGGTFTPTSLTFANSSAAQSFTYSNPSAGSVAISATSTRALPTSPPTWSFAVLANTTVVYQSFVSGLPAGYAGSATVTPQVFTGAAMATPGMATAGTPVETSVPGSYWCEVTYHSTDLAWPSVPSVTWSVGGQTIVDPNPKGRALVDPAGLDGISIEAGINLPQAIAIVAAACAGQSSGVSAGTPTYKAAGNPSQTRIAAVAAGGNRSSVTLTLPGI